MLIETRQLDTIRPYGGNPRKISARAVAKVALSLTTYGWRQPIVVDAAGVIVVGHTRYLAAMQLGWTEGPVHVAGDLTEAQVRAYRIMDNRSHEEAAWDLDLTTVELGDLKGLNFDLSLTGFDPRELGKMLPESLTEPEAQVERADELQAKWKVERGQVWEIGWHRLMCGDSASADVAVLMDGEKADMVFTDPPYGVNYTGGAKEREPLQGDHFGSDLYGQALPCLRFAAADHAALYLWYADANVAAAAAAAAGYVITAQVVWVKNNAQFVSSAHYHGKHEPCFYAHRKGKTAAWYGGNTQVTVWDVDRAAVNEYHPTQKPPELARRALTNSTEQRGLVLDLFLGGGSTMVAAEQLDRRCYGMEIEPKYCAVILERMTALGLAPQLAKAPAHA